MSWVGSVNSLKFLGTTVFTKFPFVIQIGIARGGVVGVKLLLEKICQPEKMIEIDHENMISWIKPHPLNILTL
jgi:hypothetical protein